MTEWLPCYFGPRSASPPPTRSTTWAAGSSTTARSEMAKPLAGYKLCPECGQPVLKKGQQRKHPDDYRHARGCPNADRSDDP
jgi:hypothetical protein